jgi:hypothetical protein
MKLAKSEKSLAQTAWKQERSDERWERRADMLMFRFSHVSVMLPSQITHLNGKRPVVSGMLQ